MLRVSRVRINFVQSDGSAVQIDGTSGDSLMAAALGGAVRGIHAECGGNCVCGTCHVYVEKDCLGRMPMPDDFEAEMLDAVAAERRVNSRLACQIKLAPALDGMVVEVPERQF
jgi:2Fe-2S ferredoxin